MRYLAVAVLCITSLSLYAQDTPELDQGDIQDAQIIIKKDRSILLPQERKLYELIKWTPQRPGHSPRPNTFQKHTYTPIETAPKYELADPSKSENEVSYLHYLKAGFGNFGSPLIDLSMSAPGNSNQVLGLNFKHESFSSGAVDGENSASSINQVNLYGILNGEKVSLTGKLSFQSDKNYFFGYQTIGDVDRDTIRHTNNFFDVSAAIADNNATDQWAYTLSIGFKAYSDNFTAKENTLNVSGNASFNDAFNVSTDLSLSKYEDTTSTSRSYFRLTPYYALTLNQLTLDLGFSINLQNDNFGELSTSKFFPYINANYDLSAVIRLFATLDGGYQFNTIYDFAYENPYLNTALNIFNTEKSFDLAAGINVNPDKRFSGSFTLGFMSLRNIAVYVNTLTDVSKFDIAYDTESTEVFSTSLNGKFLIDSKNYLDARFSFYQYGASTLREIYHKPTVVFNLGGHHGLLDKLNVNWNFELQSGIQALDAFTDTDISLSASPILDLSIDYQVKEEWSLFVAAKNIFSQEYSLLYRYPQRGTQFKGGLTLRF